MISELYKNLKEIADSEYGDIIRESEIVLSYTGRARKLRLKLVDNTFIDIWYTLEGDYSFHWEQRNVRESIYRHDNAPHKKWAYVKTFPKHCHNGLQEKVIESNLSNIPMQAIREFLVLVRKRIIEKRREK